MLFSDNNQTFCFPFNTFSLFLKIYDLRNTDVIGAAPIPRLEIQVISEEKEILKVAYNLMDAYFINTLPLGYVYSFLTSMRTGIWFDAYSDYEFPLFNFFLKLTPNIYLRIGNQYDSVDEKFIDDINSVALCSEKGVYNDNYICSSDIPDLRPIIGMAEEFNKYLIDKLKELSLWEQYCKKHRMNVDWELDVNINEKQMVTKDQAIEIAKNQIPNFERRFLSINEEIPKSLLNDLFPIAEVFPECWTIHYSQFINPEEYMCSIVSSSAILIEKETGEIFFNGNLRDEG